MINSCVFLKLLTKQIYYHFTGCPDAADVKTFPDIGYILMGYDILKGFPQADSHDPGFTFSIFRADYLTKERTADCRYGVPHGLQIIPDISCDVSFESKVVRNQQDLASSLSVSASVSGGGWGVSFSASAGYKKSSRSMLRGEYVYITSQASCNYYYSRLIQDDPPPFDPTFIFWVKELNTKNDQDTYIKFFSLYGTHYLTDSTFGARFVKNYRMKTKEYQRQESSGVDVAVSASYSGIFSVGGGFSLDSSQQSAVSNFMSSVTSETKSIGAAPPANGDSLTWASTVKNNPIPSTYKLSSIENLFTDKYMKTLNVNYNNINSNIKRYKSKYCNYMKAIGKVDSCVSLQSALNIKQTKLKNPFKTVPNTFLDSCEESCTKSPVCEAISYCINCGSGQSDYRKCYMFSSVLKQITAQNDASYITTIYRNTILQNTMIEGLQLLPGNTTLKSFNLGQCNTALKNEPKGVAFTYTLTGTNKCQIFAWNDIKHLSEKTRTSTTVLLDV